MKKIIRTGRSCEMCGAEVRRPDKEVRIRRKSWCSRRHCDIWIGKMRRGICDVCGRGIRRNCTTSGTPGEDEFYIYHTRCEAGYNRKILIPKLEKIHIESEGKWIPLEKVFKDLKREKK